MSRTLAVVGSLMMLASLGLAIGYYIRDAPAADELDRDRRVLMHAVVSVLEHDTAIFPYGYIDDRHDGRGYSAGRGSFSTAGGEVSSVVQDFAGKAPYHALTRYLEALRTLSEANSDGFVGLDGFVTAWQEAATDPELRAAQDRAMDRLFVAPAQERATSLGLVSTLGLVVLYDSAVQHGTHSGADGLDGLIARATAEVGGSPASGVSEEEWLGRFLAIRRAVLLNPYETTRQEAWARTAGRIDALSELLDAGNTDLRTPLTLNPYGTPHLLVSPHDATTAPDTAALAPSTGPTVWLSPSPAPPGTPVATPTSGLAAQPSAKASTPVGAPSPARASNVINVSTTAALRAALAEAQPGHVITLADGTYSGVFDVTRSGTASKPITLQGSLAAVLTSTGSGLSVRASYWRLKGFSIRKSLVGVMLDDAHHNVLDGLTIREIDHEGVHFRRHSTHNTLTRSTIRDTGRTAPDFGRAVSIGSTANTWDQVTGGEPDRSSFNRVVANTLGPDLRGGVIMADEGTVGGVIADNRFDGAGMTATAWVIARGNDYQVTGNSGVTSQRDGFYTFVRMTGWGCGNVFRANRADVRASGYGIRVDAQPGCLTVVHADNSVLNAGSGLTNIAVQPP